MGRGALLLVLWALVGGLPGEVATAQKDPPPCAERLLELERRVRVGEVETSRLRRVIADLEARLAAAAGTAPKISVSPPPASPPELDLGGEIEVVDVDDADLEIAPSKTPSPFPEPATPTESTPISDAAQSLYDRSYTLYNEGRYAEAEAAFRSYVETHPDTELADNAQFWIGECRFAQQDFEGALEAFLQTVERYPEGNKIPDAMLKAGRSLEELGNTEDALVTYREVRRRYPGTAASALAKERLAALE